MRQFSSRSLQWCVPPSQGCRRVRRHRRARLWCTDGLGSAPAGLTGSEGASSGRGGWSGEGPGESCCPTGSGPACPAPPQRVRWLQVSRAPGQLPSASGGNPGGMGWHVMLHGHRPLQLDKETLQAPQPASAESGEAPWLWPSSLSLVCPRDTVSSPNANLLLGCGRFSPPAKVGRGKRNPCVGAFSLPSAGVPSEVPSVQAQHTQDQPPERVAGCPRAACPGHTRGEVGSRLQTKPGSCCWSGISGEGMISTTINASDYLIRGKMRSPGGGPHTQKRNNPCPAGSDRAGR